MDRHDRLTFIAEAARQEAQGIRRCFPVVGKRWLYDGEVPWQNLIDEVANRLNQLERLINPSRLPFGEERRGNIHRLLGGPISWSLMAPLEVLVRRHDEILRHYGVEEEICTATCPNMPSCLYPSWLWWPTHSVARIGSRILRDLEQAADDLLEKLSEPDLQAHLLLSGADGQTPAGESTACPGKPRWDKSALPYKLYWGDVVIRTVASENADRIIPILDAFESSGWPPRIVGPFSPQLGQQAFHDAVKSLNKNLRLIKFQGAWKGNSVFWNPTTSDEDGPL